MALSRRAAVASKVARAAAVVARLTEAVHKHGAAEPCNPLDLDPRGTVRPMRFSLTVYPRNWPCARINMTRTEAKPRTLSVFRAAMRHLAARWPVLPHTLHALSLFGQSRTMCAVEPQAWHWAADAQSLARWPYCVGIFDHGGGCVKDI